MNLLESQLPLHILRYLITVTNAPLMSEKTAAICALRVEVAVHFVNQMNRLSEVANMAHCGEPTETLRTRHSRHSSKKRCIRKQDVRRVQKVLDTPRLGVSIS